MPSGEGKAEQEILVMLDDAQAESMGRGLLTTLEESEDLSALELSQGK